MKLLYFSRGYTTHDRRYLQGFVESGYSVSYLRLLGERLDSRNVPDGVNCIEWVGDRLSLVTPLDYLRRYFALRRIIGGLCPQVILAGPIQTSAFLVALTGYSPLVSMSWGSDILVDANVNGLSRKITRYTLARSKGVLGDCKAVRDGIQAFATLPDDRIVTFPWGVDLERFRPHPSRLSLCKDLGWTGRPVLISTRTWEPLYAVDVLVRAFATVQKTHPETRLILLGDGSQGPQIHSLISRLNLTDFVHVPGRVDYALLPEYLCLADIYVSAALSDGTSISLIEAMACGLPVIVTDGFGNNEWVTPRENGWLVPGHDAMALAAVINEALADPLRLEQMKHANLTVACNRADWRKNFPQLLTLFGRLTGES